MVDKISVPFAVGYTQLQSWILCSTVYSIPMLMSRSSIITWNELRFGNGRNFRRGSIPDRKKVVYLLALLYSNLVKVFSMAWAANNHYLN